MYFDCGGILLTLHSISSWSQSHPPPLLLDKGLRVFHAVSFRKVFNDLAFVPEAAHTDPARQVIVVVLQGQRVSFDNFNFSDDGIVRRRRPSSSPSSWPAPPPPPSPPTCLGCCQLLLYSQLPLLLPHLQPHLRLRGDLLRDHHDLVLRRLGTVDQPDFGKLTVSLSVRIFYQDGRSQ